MQHTLIIQNVKTTFLTSLTLTYVLHTFACIWIYLGIATADGWWYKDLAPKHNENELQTIITTVFDSVEDSVIQTELEVTKARQKAIAKKEKEDELALLAKIKK
jgi:hypothetical protein